MTDKKELIYSLIPKIMGDIGHVGKEKTAKTEEKNNYDNG